MNALMVKSKQTPRLTEDRAGTQENEAQLCAQSRGTIYAQKARS